MRCLVVACVLAVSVATAAAQPATDPRGAMPSPSPGKLVVGRYL